MALTLLMIGVDAVIHTAAPNVGREATAEAALNVCHLLFIQMKRDLPEWPSGCN